MSTTITMRRLLSLTSYFSLILLAPSAAWATDAAVVEGNPAGAQYLARYVKNGLDIQIVAATPADGQGVNFVVNMNGDVNLGATDYIYHIHDQPVPESGNCTATLAHLDPYGRGEDPECDSSNQASCQVGDLSGKHGAIPTLPGFSTNYTDKFISLTPGTAAFMGNRSFVLHFPNKTRIACANFEFVQKNSTAITSTTTLGGTDGTIVTASGLPSAPSSGAPTPSGAGGASATGAGTSSVPAASNAAMKQMTQKHKAVLGPLVLGIAAAVL